MQTYSIVFSRAVVIIGIHAEFTMHGGPEK